MPAEARFAAYDLRFFRLKRAPRIVVQRGPGKTRGAALLVALLVLAAASVMVAELVRRAQLDQARTLLIADSERAWQLASGLESLVRARLQRDTDQADAMIERGEVAFPVPGGVVRGRLTDPGGRFNLNTLAAADVAQRQRARQALRVLLEQATDSARAEAIMQGLNALFRPAGAVAFAPLIDITELDQLSVWDDGMRRQLAPWLTVLPDTDTALNVNQSSAEVLAAWVDGLSRAAAERVLARGPFETVADVMAAPELNRLQASMRLDVRSQWLWLHVQVELAGRQHDFSRLIRRAGNEYDSRYVRIGSL